LIRAIVASGELRFTGHALDEMRKDGMTEIDVVNVLRGGAVGEAEFEPGGRNDEVHCVRLDDEDGTRELPLW
jgi:hypothetical protein